MKIDPNKYNFIEVYENAFDMCDEVINYFEENPQIQHERTEEEKKMDIEDKHIWMRYNKKDTLGNKILYKTDEVLRKYFEEYKKKYKESKIFTKCHGLVDYRINEFKIQKSLPGQAYSPWHTERVYNNGHEEYHRFLVYIIYLNTIKEDGETAFLYQDVKVKPKKGSLCLFPADFTHVHKGITSKTETKYILTGWFCDSVKF